MPISPAHADDGYCTLISGIGGAVYADARQKIPALYRYSGAGYLAGTVTVNGQPAERPVRVYDHESGDLIARGESDEAGAYEFRRGAWGFDTGRQYLLVAIDEPDDIYNAAVADLITPAAS